MKLTKRNLYIKEIEDKQFVICIELPDNTRNYMHCQPMVLNDCYTTIDELEGLDIPSDANDPYLESDGTYYRVRMTIEPKNLSINHDLHFHSRKLNLNDAVRERQMILKESEFVRI